MKAKVIQIQTEDTAKVAEKLEEALNAFLEANPKATVHNLKMNVLDVGGPSQADILAVCVVMYT